MDYWTSSVSLGDEFEKLVLRMNPPTYNLYIFAFISRLVTVDNDSDKKATLIKVASANKRGSLLEVVQVITDMNLIIKKGYISSDGKWFMDVFHVTDQQNKKVFNDNITEKIQQSLGPKGRSFRNFTRSVGVQSAIEHTTIELTGRDRPGLLSEVFAVLTDLKCDVVAAELWTHNSRVASVVYITDEANGLAIDDPDRLSKIKQFLLYVMKVDQDKHSANTAVSEENTHRERRLHQMMYADRDYDKEDTVCGRSKPLVTVENCKDKGYTLVNVRCTDRPKLLFDTACTLTDMQYVVFHGTMNAEGTQAHQEYYIRHTDGCPVSSEAERQRVINCLQAAIKRRDSEGIRLELCGEARLGLLSDVTRIFREHGLSVTRAEVRTRGTQALNVFYVTDASGYRAKSETIEAVRKEIGQTILRVTDDIYSDSPQQQTGWFSLGTLFRSRSEKLLYNLGLTKSYS